MRPGLPYFPAPSFFIDAAVEGTIVFSPKALYKKEYRLNQCNIPGSNGVIKLSIPLTGGRKNSLPFDAVTIDQSKPWWRDHFRSLESVYGRSPFFSSYADELRSMYDQPKFSLYEWNLDCLRWTLRKLKLDRQISIVEKEKHHEADGLNENKGFNVERKAPMSGGLIYQQVFQERTGFIRDVSVLDLLFAVGPDAGLKIWTKAVKP